MLSDTRSRFDSLTEHSDTMTDVWMRKPRDLCACFPPDSGVRIVGMWTVCGGTHKLCSNRHTQKQKCTVTTGISDATSCQSLLKISGTLHYTFQRFGPTHHPQVCSTMNHSQVHKIQPTQLTGVWASVWSSTTLEWDSTTQLTSGTDLFRRSIHLHVWGIVTVKKQDKE